MSDSPGPGQARAGPGGLAAELPGLADLAVIGRGGFAVVYQARQPALRRDVAVKLLETPVGDAVARRRFERECAAMGSVADHPHILTVFDAGFLPGHRGYLVMDLARRGSLADRLERGGPLPWQDTAAIGVKMAGALETAHRAGILHRDVKPANILLTTYGEPQLADFGIARLAGEEHTRTGALAASLAYAAPEVLDGRDASVRSDVYSLGATLHCLLTGMPAYVHPGDESFLVAVGRILTEPVPDLRPHGVPDRLARVVERCLAKVPEERFASCEELGLALRVVQREQGVAVTPLLVSGTALPAPEEPAAASTPTVALQRPPAPARAQEPPTPPRPRSARHGTRRRREVGLVLVGVVALLAAGAVLLAVGLRDGGAAPPAAPAVPTPGARLAGLDPRAVVVAASSTLPPAGDLTYGPGNTLDGDLQTAWNHGNGGDAAGETLRFQFDAPVDLRTVGLVNGYAKTAELYEANHRLREVVLRTAAGAFPVTLDDTAAHQEVARFFGTTDFLELRVVSVYQGAEYDDLAVTEVDFTIATDG